MNPKNKTEHKLAQKKERRQKRLTKRVERLGYVCLGFDSESMFREEDGRDVKFSMKTNIEWAMKLSKFNKLHEMKDKMKRMQSSKDIRDKIYNYEISGFIDYSSPLTALPDSLLRKIGEHLVIDVDPFNINGPDIVARDLASSKIAGKALKPLFDQGFKKMKDLCALKTIGDQGIQGIQDDFEGSLDYTDDIDTDDYYHDIKRIQRFRGIQDRFYEFIWISRHNMKSVSFLNCFTTQYLTNLMLRFFKNPMDLNMTELNSIAAQATINTPHTWKCISKAHYVDELISFMKLSPYMYGRFPCDDESDIIFLRHIIFAKNCDAHDLFDFDYSFFKTPDDPIPGVSLFDMRHNFRQRFDRDDKEQKYRSINDFRQKMIKMLGTSCRDNIFKTRSAKSEVEKIRSVDEFLENEKEEWDLAWEMKCDVLKNK